MRLRFSYGSSIAKYHGHKKINLSLGNESKSQLTGLGLSQEWLTQMKAEGFEALQASELCFRLLTHPSFNLMQRLKAGQSRAAKHPNTLLSPSDSHRRRHPVFKSVRRASLICFHSKFFLPLSRAARPPAYFIQLSRPLDVDLLPVKGAAFS